jgi:hypothetical protein
VYIQLFVKYKIRIFAQKNMLNKDFKKVEKSKEEDFLVFKLNKNLWLKKLFLKNINKYKNSFL